MASAGPSPALQEACVQGGGQSTAPQQGELGGGGLRASGRPGGRAGEWGAELGKYPKNMKHSKSNNFWSNPTTESYFKKPQYNNHKSLKFTIYFS